MQPVVAWSNWHAQNAADLLRFANGQTIWQPELLQTHALLVSETLPIDEQIAAIQKAQRLLMLHVLGFGADPDFRQKLESSPLTNWEQFSTPPVPESMLNRLVELLDIAMGKPSATVELGDTTRIIGPKLVQRLLQRGVQVSVYVLDENARNIALNAASDEAVKTYGAYILQQRLSAVTRIHAAHNIPVWPAVGLKPEKFRILKTELAPYAQEMAKGTIAPVLTTIPTQADAEIDGLDYTEYCNLFFRMCDQPWAEIETAQAHLISILNPAKTLRFTNSDGTDVQCDITGFTFCNSTIKRNIPGSEVFSAPHRTSMNGIVVAKGKFSVKEEQGAIAENMVLKFKDGCVVEATAEKGQHHLDAALALDAGARYVGEIAIGTNPYLKRHLASILLSEKIGGSFHFALGDAYQMTDYLGQSVVVDNGNRSVLHWDITTMLYGKQGKIFVDGVMIMDDGMFLDPKLAVLNFGWNALPEHQRPTHWRTAK